MAMPEPVAVALALLDCRSLHADVLVRSHAQIIVTSGWFSRCTRTCAGLPPSVAYRRPMMDARLGDLIGQHVAPRQIHWQDAERRQLREGLNPCSLPHLLFRKI